MYYAICSAYVRRHAPKNTKEPTTTVGRVVGKKRRGAPARSPFERAAEVAAAAEKGR